MQPVRYDPNYDLVPAFPGMIADSGFSDTVTIACGPTPQPFGTVVGEDTATGRSVFPITNPKGVALHDHNYAGRVGGVDGYTQFDAMSVAQRRRVWGLASGTCSKDQVAKYNPANGTFSDAGTATMPNAKFLSANIACVGVRPGEAAAQMVLVELHSPTV